MAQEGYFHPYTRPQEKIPLYQFCRISMRPISLLEKNYLSQKWKFKCPNCEIEFAEWV